VKQAPAPVGSFHVGAGARCSGREARRSGGIAAFRDTASSPAHLSYFLMSRGIIGAMLRPSKAPHHLLKRGIPLFPRFQSADCCVARLRRPHNGGKKPDPTVGHAKKQRSGSGRPSSGEQDTLSDQILNLGFPDPIPKIYIRSRAAELSRGRMPPCPAARSIRSRDLEFHPRLASPVFRMRPRRRLVFRAEHFH
jgi:hypothetical protein